MKQFEFFKYHGIGNDLVLVDLTAGGVPVTSAEAVELCDRNFGVGADGVLTLLPSRKAAFRMHIRNSDGSVAEMCGNGLRCAAKYAYDHGRVVVFLGDDETNGIAAAAGFQVKRGTRLSGFAVETGRGVLHCVIEAAADGIANSVWVNMGAPILERSAIPMTGTGRFLGREVRAAGKVFTGSAIGMGNPHLVLFAGDDMEQAMKYGPILERSPLFPRKTNVEFARVVSESELSVVVWERGCGITKACGTGACATVVAHAMAGHVPFGREVRVVLPGGVLGVSVPADLHAVYMRGPAVEVFRGWAGEQGRRRA
ncbi:MAG: diaminopimelate epimerase [Myxococcota bacterium]